MFTPGTGMRGIHDRNGVATGSRKSPKRGISTIADPDAHRPARSSPGGAAPGRSGSRAPRSPRPGRGPAPCRTRPRDRRTAGAPGAGPRRAPRRPEPGPGRGRPGSSATLRSGRARVVHEPGQAEAEAVGDGVPRYPDTAQRRLLEEASGMPRAAATVPRRFDRTGLPAWRKTRPRLPPPGCSRSSRRGSRSSWAAPPRRRSSGSRARCRGPRAAPSPRTRRPCGSCCLP